MIKRIDVPVWFSLLALVLLCLPLASFSQDSPLQTPAEQNPVATMRVQAREVLLLVTVRDKHGALVADLQKSDFTLTDNERPQTIKSFSRETNLSFLIGLLVDTSGSVSSALEDERKAAGKFVDEMLPAQPQAGPASQTDRAFVIHFDREVELLQDFTSSRDKLHHQIDEMGPTRDTQRDRQGPRSRGGDRDHANRRGGTQLYDALFLASDELMKVKNGRKALVIYSDGVDRGSEETLTQAVDAADRANVVVYTIYLKGEEHGNAGFGFPGGGGRHGGGFPSGGGYPGGGGREPEVDGKKIMEQIAKRTGGRFFEAKKKENLDEIYGQITEELRGQYLLTYTPDVVDNEGGYHRVALKANKADLTVVTREGVLRAQRCIIEVIRTYPRLMTHSFIEVGLRLPYRWARPPTSQRIVDQTAKLEEVHRDGSVRRSSACPKATLLTNKKASSLDEAFLDCDGRNPRTPTVACIN